MPEIFRAINFTLLSEGTSDRALIPILDWILSVHAPAAAAVIGSIVDTARLPVGVLSTPRKRLQAAVDTYPCSILFLHRDADAQAWETRRVEIEGWLKDAELPPSVTSIPVIPIRNSEAWLLTDEEAIRAAAGNPNGRIALNLPKIGRLEHVGDPKDTLFEALRIASGLSGRRRKTFDVNQARADVAKYMLHKDMLRQLPAFQKLELLVQSTSRNNGRT